MMSVVKKTLSIILCLTVLFLVHTCSYEEDSVSQNQPPVADAGLDIVAKGGDTVTLDGSNSNDPDGSITEYLWTQTDGVFVSLADENSPQTTFTAPSGVLSGGSITFELTVTDDIGSSSSDTVTTSVVPAFIDDFSTDTTGEYTVTHISAGTGQFLYDGVGQRAQVLTGEGVGLQFSHSLPLFDTGTFSIDFRPTVRYGGGRIWIRLIQDQFNFYEIYDTDGFGPGSGWIRKFVSGQEVERVPIQSEFTQDSDYTIILDISPQVSVLSGFGEVLTLGTNSDSIQVATLEVETEQQDAYFDNIIVTVEPYVSIKTPPGGIFQWETDLSATAFAANLQAGEGLRFLVDAGTAGEISVDDYTKPYSVTFQGLKPGVHTVDALVIDGSGTAVSGPWSSDRVAGIQIGGYYVGFGDSITAGSRDDIPGDGIGYEPILESLLASATGVAHNVINAGLAGETSADGAGRISSVVDANPDAEIYLILYGSNDAQSSVPRSTFRANMESIVLTLISSGKTPLLSKVPYNDGQCPSCDPFIVAYNQAIDDLKNAHGIAVVPPDFYNHFKNNPSELFDGLHPNGVGYQSMADLWFDALTQ